MVPMLTAAKTARIVSTDPISKENITITILEQSLESFKPMDAKGMFVSSELSEVMDRVGDAFCSHVKHFASTETAKEFIAQNPKRFILNMDEFHEVAKELYAAIWT